MIPEVDIFVGNYTIIDCELYDLWISGLSVLEAVSTMKQRGVLKVWKSNSDLLLSDVADHYRTFERLEKILPTPVMLSEEWTFQIHPSVQKYVIEQFYSFDGPVIREILGKKLSSRTRKDLDDVADKTGVLLKSCRRQFDNVKRIYKQLDDLTGSLRQSIQSMFLLSTSLAHSYATIVFLTSNRFETSKKRLSYLTWDDFSVCASAMMAYWTTTTNRDKSQETAVAPAITSVATAASRDKSQETAIAATATSDCDCDCDLERDFLIALRDLKVVLEKDKEHRNVTLSRLRDKISDRLCCDVESNFKPYSRAFVNIAVNLINSRDARDFFVNVVERIIEPSRVGRWNCGEFAAFVEAYADAGSSLEVMKSDPSLRVTWERYMRVMRICVKKMYHS